MYKTWTQTKQGRIEKLIYAIVSEDDNYVLYARGKYITTNKDIEKLKMLVSKKEKSLKFLTSTRST